jgi:hypothetical protein
VRSRSINVFIHSHPIEEKAMTHTHIILLVIGEVVSFALFLYVLYLFGGMYQHVKKIAEKVEILEKKLEKN